MSEPTTTATSIVTDVITYAGEISMQGYESVCEALKQRKGTKALLVIATPGGDPHAGFRIARAMQHAYGEFSLLVPRFCKSAGTLIAIGASTLYLDDMSELGPLDIQVKKNDELVGRNSGLDIIAAVDYLRDQSMNAFNRHCTELVAGAGLSTKAASEIAARLSIGMLEPIAAQIDPMKLAEMQRAMDIAYQYGTRLNETSKNLRSQGLDLLVTGYPSHGFVIDRKEAKSIFITVKRPESVMKMLSEALNNIMDGQTNSRSPIVNILSHSIDFTGDVNEAQSPDIQPAGVVSQVAQPVAELRPNAGPSEGDGEGAGTKSATDQSTAANDGNTPETKTA